VIETPFVRAVFTNKGGVLKNWLLKRYAGPDSQALDLIPRGLPETVSRPFSLKLPDAEATHVLEGALFRTTAEIVKVEDQPASLDFEYDDGAGLVVRKQFRFEPVKNPYGVVFSLSAAKDGQPLNPTIVWGPGPADLRESSSFLQHPEAIFAHAGSATRLTPSNVREQPVRNGPFDFVGADDHYFLAAFIPRGQDVKVTYEPVGAETGSGGELVAFSLDMGRAPEAAEFFVGPKEFDVLASVERELVRAIHFGWFAPLVTPLLRALKWINAYVGNYGWAIIILTIIINLAMFPLRHKSVVSMRRMQELQPEVKAIQDRYAKLKTTDPARQKMNVELMNLYRERGVNPASGCLPMLLTMPVLFAFYSLLSVAIEIRGAPFVGWIQDLSVHDPLYVTPVLMGMTMVWQQMITPTTADPVQQKIMMIMPVMFTVMFLWAPSGLVLYWLVSNLWAIGQQQVTNRIIGPPVARTVRPAAERRLKNVGSGKTERAKEGV
jgi:YidC/Oxa1 family membrane protein insertase